MDKKDKELFEKLEICVLDSLDESKAVEFFAKLEIDEYARLISMFKKMDESIVPEEVKKQLINLFENLQRSKQAALS